MLLQHFRVTVMWNRSIYLLNVKTQTTTILYPLYATWEPEGAGRGQRL